ncbi:transcription antitermination factor NusB [Eubacterium sp. MSJ-13]|uniref:transcription antitermination factor NusB n=1 Tax=Eubacterium sp. MSJ-13 TaxID=2841513 RepID=UPI001C125FC6|nr:transcription antitermination factor NusB [Eubacterium sp. MSJ-13]MBU5479240.1 transcription antitermination factor NusB [Eubacterium sp. MSJ-13]
MTRRQIRENLYKMLFQVEFHDKESLKTQMEIYLDDLKGADEKDKRELTDKFNELVENLEQIDTKIEEKADGWTIERIAKSELTILRLGVYELLYVEDVPNKVAINEAVELAKAYGADKASGFINGILASVVREIPE